MTNNVHLKYKKPKNHGHSNKKKSVSITGINLEAPHHRFRSFNNRTQIDNVTLSVAFTNLSETKDPIAVTRMRPLIWVSEATFVINGRLGMH